MTKPPDTAIRFLLCGDVMTGRGIDQILPFPSDPALHEPSVIDARSYVALAERSSGPIPRQVPFPYVWGNVLQEMNQYRPDVAMVNLETAVTTNDRFWPDKEIHYRMNPKNVNCLTAARIDCCHLANNHVLDWGYAGLEQTMQTLDGAGIRFIGAGRNLREAQTPTKVRIAEKGNVLLFGMGSLSSGIPDAWEATETKQGVSLVDEGSPASVQRVCRSVKSFVDSQSVVIVSIHWGGNWGYKIPAEQQDFAHALIDDAGVDAVFGHSSHHVKGIEVYKGKTIIYGAGDLLDDYEGISGYERYRGDLGLIYLLTVNAVDGRLARLDMVPTQVRRFQLTPPRAEDVELMTQILNREGRSFGTSVVQQTSRSLGLRWN